MTFFLFIVALLVQIFTVWAVFYFSVSRSVGSIVTIIVGLACAFVFTAWSLLLGIPLILLSVILLVDPLRFGLITKPAYKTLANSMPSISTTEQEALEAGTSWWEKELLQAHLIGIHSMPMLFHNYLKKSKLIWTLKLNSFVAC